MTSEEAAQRILQEYDAKHSLYSDFTLKQEHLISEVLRERSFSPHSVTSRLKSRQSLQGKLARADADYTRLSDITDISGVRITTYFNDEVDRVAAYLDEEFETVKEHSVDKRKILDADRFGYLSLHYVVRLPSDRLKLTEYRRFPDLSCEVQIRSILQHAWAEIEHDLGYKSRIAVPKILRRRFSRLAGLLELADEEFVTIRNGLAEYQERLPTEIEKSAAVVALDKLSLHEFLKSNLTATKLDQEIATMFGAELKEDPGLLELGLREMSFFAIDTIAVLEGLLKENGERIRGFSELWIGSSRYPQIGRGICLLYLSYLLAAQSGNEGFVIRFLTEIGIGIEYQNSAKRILATFAAIQPR